ncbi:MAG: murein biosynthesis integral membrane protein MurJ [Candidatus Levyibacteriota bacterium]|nr:MAG: murein biosynthesis integral membrane protein MurJ [Candidatus Levybacteria bacterium]
MPKNFLQKSWNLLLQRQTNILSAAFVIMGTVFLSQVLGLIRQRLLVSIFGASNTLGVYLTANRFPDLLFQIIIAGALYSAFIPVFSDYMAKNREKDAHKMASTFLALSCVIFLLFSLFLFIFAPFFLSFFNIGGKYSLEQMILMTNLTRIILAAQFLFIAATFFSALLQSYNHFFIPGIAAATYNLGIIIGILTLSSSFGIYAPAYGCILGASFFILAQIPMVKKIGFRFTFSFEFKTSGVMDVIHLMWPRTLSNGVFQIGTLAIAALISFLSEPGRNYTIFDYAQTLAFAPVGLVGQTIAQAAFPVLSREREKLAEFRTTFLTSFTQILYLVLPISILLLVLRIPVVRLVFGAGLFDWQATVLTGRVLALLSLSIFAQSLIALVSRGFYALHNTKVPLIVGTITTVLMVMLGGVFVIFYKLGIEGIAISYAFAVICNLITLFIILDRKVGGFDKRALFVRVLKIFIASAFTGIAIYIPIKLLDQLVFDTTRTINLLLLTGISSVAGLAIYLFLTWFLNVKEALAFVILFKKLGNWREILGKSDEVIDGTRFNP